MKNVDDLIDSASELAARGLSRGEIADELNVSRETASWLVERAGTSAPVDEAPVSGPQDVHVDWSNIGEAGARLNAIGMALADALREHSHDVDLIVGVEKAGVPLATAVSNELKTDLATYTPANTSGTKATSTNSAGASAGTSRASKTASASWSTTPSPPAPPSPRLSKPSAKPTENPSPAASSSTNKASATSATSPSNPCSKSSASATTTDDARFAGFVQSRGSRVVPPRSL